MPWFQRFCRNAGLMVHHIIHPSSGARHEIHRTMEERTVNPTVTLRRTTIEEIEIRPGQDAPDQPRKHDATE